MKHIENAQIVQGLLEQRIDQRIEALTAAAEATTRASQANHRALDKLLEVVASHQERLTHVDDGMTKMEAAMNALFEHMDRFIRGLESNGHSKGRK